MTWLSTNARNPQGAGGTDWTTMGADDDDYISPSSSNAMNAAHKVNYPNDWGDTENTAYEHGEYYKDDRTVEEGDADWNDGGGWYSWSNAPHSIRWIYCSTRFAGW